MIQESDIVVGAKFKCLVDEVYCAEIGVGFEVEVTEVGREARGRLNFRTTVGAHMLEMYDHITDETFSFPAADEVLEAFDLV